MSEQSLLGKVLATALKSKEPWRYLVNVWKYRVLHRALGREVNLPIRRDLILVTSRRSASTGCAVLGDLYYEPRLMLFLERWLRPADVFLDIGANIGIFTLLVARKVPDGQVLAIEATPTIFAALQRNLAANCHRHVTALNCAVADRSQPFIFEMADGDCEGRLGAVSADQLLGPGQIVVDGKTLEECLALAKLKKVTVMKIDIEGMELPVLKNCRSWLQTVQPLILVDWYAKDLTRFMAEIGYAPFLYVAVECGGLRRMDQDADEEHGAIFVPLARINEVNARLV